MEPLFEGHLKLTCLSSIAPQVWGKIYISIGFCSGCWCVDQIFCLCQVFECWIRSEQKFIVIFIDFSAAFNSVHRESLWKAMLLDGLPAKIVNIFRNYYEGTECNVQVYGKFTNSFSITTGIQQDCILSPIIFNIIMIHQLGYESCWWTSFPICCW